MTDRKKKLTAGYIHGFYKAAQYSTYNTYNPIYHIQVLFRISFLFMLFYILIY